MMMFGRETSLPVDLIYGPHPQRDENSEETGVEFQYVDKLQKRMWKVHKKARQSIIIASEKQKRQYDLKSNQKSYTVGDVVWLYTFTRVKKRSPKLQRNWDGPYFVTQVVSDIVYKIQKSPCSKVQIVHHDRLKPFYGEVQNWVKEKQ